MRSSRSKEGQSKEAIRYLRQQKANEDVAVGIARHDVRYDVKYDGRYDVRYDVRRKI